MKMNKCYDPGDVNILFSFLLYLLALTIRSAWKEHRRDEYINKKVSHTLSFGCTYSIVHGWNLIGLKFTIYYY